MKAGHTAVDVAIDRAAEHLVALERDAIASGPRESAALDALLVQLGLDAHGPLLDSNADIRRVLWDPIAEDCIVAILRAVVGAQVEPERRWTHDEVRAAWEKDPEVAAIEHELGLATHLARAAMEACERAIFEVAGEPCTFVIDGREVLVFHEDDVLVVTPSTVSTAGASGVRTRDGAEVSDADIERKAR